MTTDEMTVEEIEKELQKHPELVPLIREASTLTEDDLQTVIDFATRQNGPD